MAKNYPFSQIQELVSSSQNFLILIPRNPSLDQVAAALSLHLSLQEAGKKTTVLSLDKMVVGFSHVVGLDQVQTNLTSNELVATLNYPVENIEKVFTTNEEKGNLQIVVRTKQGKEPIRKEDFFFSNTSFLPDLIFTIGAHKPEGLGRIYQERKEMFTKKPIVDIDNHPDNVSFGKVNLVDTSASSLCEIVTFLISQIRLPLTQDVGANLILGIREQTDNFQKGKVSADTFEAASIAMRAQELQKEALSSQQVSSRPKRPLSSQSGKEPPPEWLEPKIYKGSTLP